VLLAQPGTRQLLSRWPDGSCSTAMRPSAVLAASLSPAAAAVAAAVVAADWCVQQGMEASPAHRTHSVQQAEHILPEVVLPLIAPTSRHAIAVPSVLSAPHHFQLHAIHLTGAHAAHNDVFTHDWTKLGQRELS
jgi:hypothetical protein